ncbi:hypothetical protein R1sor_006646 [Riccia sorocarpa]|uniref:Uncharacterized protein n=1 Tax=Riccia sorocarpa TaxID=122646 RepID=A0ABD3HRV3_9MARC
MASSDPVDEEARQRAVGGDEAAKFRVRLRDDIELQLESATTMLFNAESHIVKALYDDNKELANREIYDAHGKSQDARCHIRRAMQLVNYVLASEDDTLDGRWKKKFGELEADDEVTAMEIVEYLCKCDETNPPVPGCLVHDDQGRLRLASLSENNFEKLSSLIEGLWEDMRRENKFQVVESERVEPPALLYLLSSNMQDNLGVLDWNCLLYSGRLTVVEKTLRSFAEFRQEDLAVVLRARSCCAGFILDKVILRICHFWAIHHAVGQFVCLENAALQEGRKEMLSASLKWLNDESERHMDYILADKTRFVAYVFTSAIYDEE